MNFLCDHMLGTLCRWLRILGYDAVFGGGEDDDAILRRARIEARVLLTRDRRLAAKAGDDALYVPDHNLEGQIHQVLETFHLTLDGALSRCPVCNAILRSADPKEARGRVPEGVASRYETFWRCPSCERFYWPGSHYDNMRERIERFREGVIHRPS